MKKKNKHHKIKKPQFSPSLFSEANLFFIPLSLSGTMGGSTFATVFLATCLLLLDVTLGEDSTTSSRVTVLERRHKLIRFPFMELLLDDKDDVVEKRQDHFDDYGHMRFGKRGEEWDDYGHLRFGKRD